MSRTKYSVRYREAEGYQQYEAGIEIFGEADVSTSDLVAMVADMIVGLSDRIGSSDAIVVSPPSIDDIRGDSGEIDESDLDRPGNSGDLDPDSELSVDRNGSEVPVEEG